MARKPRTPKVPETSPKLLEALRFCGSILSDKGAPVETHVVLNNKTATAFNGILAAGCYIDEDIFAAPNNSLMIEALSKCGQNYSLVQLDNGMISIKGSKFKANVPCLDPSQLPSALPDQPAIKITNDLIKAIEAVGVLATEDAQRVVAASILIRDDTCIATNGAILFEAWHGFKLPTIAIPKAFVGPLTKQSKNVSWIGGSQNSISVFFEDNSWLRTQLYAEQWPDVDAIINKPANYFPIPSGFWEGLAAVAPFSVDGMVYFDDGLIRSHASDGVGASYEVKGLPKGPIFNYKYLSLIKPHAQQIDFLAQGTTQNTTMLMFVGEKIRGALLGRL